jgi:hypothetical protein
MLVAAACMISVFVLVYTHAEADVPRAYIVLSGTCVEIPRPMCSTQGQVTCTWMMANGVTYTVYGSSTTTLCAYLLYKN